MGFLSSGHLPHDIKERRVERLGESRWPPTIMRNIRTRTTHDMGKSSVTFSLKVNPLLGLRALFRVVAVFGQKVVVLVAYVYGPEIQRSVKLGHNVAGIPN